MGKKDVVYDFLNSIVDSEVSSEKEDHTHIIILMGMIFFCGIIILHLWDVLFTERVAETTSECFPGSKSPINLPEKKEQPSLDGRADQDTNICESHTAVEQKGTLQLKKLQEIPHQQKNAEYSTIGSVSVMDENAKKKLSEPEEADNLDVTKLEVRSETEKTIGSLVSEPRQDEREGYLARIKQLEQERGAALANADLMRDECQIAVEKGRMALYVAMKLAREELTAKEEILAEIRMQLAAEQSKSSEKIEKLQEDLKESVAHARILASLFGNRKGSGNGNIKLSPKKPNQETANRDSSTLKSKLSKIFSIRPKEETKWLTINGKLTEMAMDSNCNYACISRAFWEEELNQPLLKVMNYNKWYGNRITKLSLGDFLFGKTVRQKIKWKQLLGYFVAEIKHDQTVYNLPVLVFDKPDTKNFYGRMWMRAFASNDPTNKVLI